MSDAFQIDQNETVLDESKKYYEELVGEGKKFKDPEALARSKAEADQFIARLLQEKRELEESLAKRNNEDDFLDKLKAVTRPQSEPDQDTKPDAGTREAAVDPQAIEALVEKKLTEKQAAAERKANLEKVFSKLEETYGANFKARVQAQARELGVGTDFLTDVAARTPDAFYRLMGLDQPQRPTDAFAPPPRSTAGTGSSQVGQKNYQYYQQQRREKGDHWYFSIATQREIWEQAKAQGGNPDEHTGFYKR
jgi:hypothetical protein